ncbi:MAG: hypothetical protein ABSH51_17275 [Solirubrobacteraceae bacterium]
MLSVVIVATGLAAGASPAAAAAPAALSWSAPVLIDSSPTGAHQPSETQLACPSARLCVAAQAHGVTVSTDPLARDPVWTQHSFLGIAGYDGDPLTGVACPSARLCIATGDQERLFVSRDPSGGSATWRAMLGPRVSQLTCPTPHFCAGVGDDFVAMSTDPAAGASAWRQTTFEAGYNALTSVSCPSGALCVATDDDGNVLTATDPTDPAGWSVGSIAPPGWTASSEDPVATSCPSPALCVAIAGTDVVTSTDPAAGASSWHAASAYAGPLASQATLTSIACPSASLCVAGNLDGQVLAGSDPAAGGGAWTATRVGMRETFGPSGTDDRPIDSISCSGDQLCLATDGWHVFISTDPAGGVWTTDTPPALGGPVYCASTRLCVLAAGGLLLTTTDPGARTPAWRTTRLALPALSAIGAVACSPSLRCVALDESSGDAATSDDPTGGAKAWSITRIDAVAPEDGFPVSTLDGVACPTDRLCVAIDELGDVVDGIAGDH